MNKISLFVNYYIDSNKERQKELEYCLNCNIENKYIEQIFLLHEYNVVIPDNPKLIGVNVGNRPTFDDMFAFANNFDGIKIIANSDIYFNDTIALCSKLNEKEVFALNRWDLNKDGGLEFFNKNDSQDVWIYKGKVNNLNAYFNIGQMGCDCVLAYELDKCGFNVLSPSKQIQAIHVDRLKKKNYEELQKTSLVHKRPYKTLKLMEFPEPKDYTILFKYPVRERRDKFFKTLDEYYFLMSKNSKFNFIITMDEDDKIMNCKEVRERLKKYKYLTYFYGNNKCKIEAVNADIPESGFDIIVLVSDDMIPQVQDYDNIIRKKMTFCYPDTDGVLWFNDGCPNARQLNTLCILGKKYYDRFGYIYFPDYKNFWCDKEFMEVANSFGKQTYFDECIIRHEHFEWGYGEKDKMYIETIKKCPLDKALYYKREKTGFRTTIPKIAYFVWSKGTPLSYFRYLTLQTFRKQNPDYKMILYLSKAIEVKNWKGNTEQEYYNKKKNDIEDYLPKVKDLNVEVKEYNKYNNLNPTQIADLFRFEKLYETGGWFFDCDQLFLNPIPEFMINNYDFVLGCKSIPYIGVIGAVRGSKSCEAIRNKQLGILKDNKLSDYQSLGIILLQEYLNSSVIEEKILNTEDEVFYPVYWDKVGDLYKGKINIFDFTDSIALHWHGGYPASQEFNFKFNEKFAKTSKDSISRYMRNEDINPLNVIDEKGKLNILIIVSEMVSLSGSPMYHYTLAKELSNRGYEVDIFSQFTTNITRSNLLTSNVNIIDGIDKEKYYDIVFISQPKYSDLVGMINSFRIINICHSEYKEETPIINNKIAKYIAIRPSIKDHLILEHKIKEDKIEVIYNGIDFNRFNKSKRKKHEGNYTKVVLPCSIHDFRIPFIRYYTDKANENFRVFIYGQNFMPEFAKTVNKWVIITDAQFDIENYITDADIVAGVLYGRVNLEASAMGVKSFIHNPENPSEYYEFEVKEQEFEKRHNIINVADSVINLAKTIKMPKQNIAIVQEAIQTPKNKEVNHHYVPINKDVQEKFYTIYKTNHWRDKDSVSGTGSNLEQTRVLISKLPQIIEKYEVTSFLDIPCGDFFWMSRVNFPETVKYIGAEIVSEIINKNKEKYSNTDFRVLDIINSSLPKVVMVFVRDCLVHLPYSEIFKAIKNIKSSGSILLVTTNFMERGENTDIKLGDWRPLNFMKAPFNFPNPTETILEDCQEFNGQFKDKAICVWRLNDINV